MEQSSEKKLSLFSQCRICIIISFDLEQPEAEQLAKDIRAYGGQVEQHRVPVPLSGFERFTHIISSTIDFPEYNQICDTLIPVIKPEWIDTCILQLRLVNPRQYNPDPRRFLSDVSLTCADIPDGDRHAIVGAVLAMGGLHTAKLTSNTTHVVALSIEARKCQAALKMNEKLAQIEKSQICIVLPHWFDDCLKLGKRIDERPYLLPDPEILRATGDVPVRVRKSKDVAGASCPSPSSIPPALNKDAKHVVEVFQGRTLKLSNDLDISDYLRKSIEDLVRGGGGHITEDIHEAGIYICRYREGEVYKAATLANKEIGNLSWLFHVITRNTWTSPTRRLLHYPVARQGIPGFKGLRISLSNYVGEARTYLENLINATGAECTKHLKQNNSHLITAHGTSEKCTAAKEWGIQIVNHLWLEESYASWKRQPESNPRYTHLPLRTNLSEVVGQTAIDRKAIRLISSSYPVESKTKLNATKSDTGERPMAPREVNEVQNPSNKRQNEKSTDSISEDQVNDREKELFRATSQTPTLAPLQQQKQENETPPMVHSRKSKDKATALLHQFGEDMALYEREKKRAGGVIYGGMKRHESASKEPEEAKPRKRSLVADDATSKEMKETKRARSTLSHIQMHLLVTGFKRWVHEPKLEGSDKRALRDIGIQVVTDPKKCTHLAAPSILRTPKFLNAVAYAPQILNDRFVEQCIKENKLLDANDFILKDEANEERYKISLGAVRLRAQKNKNKLLSGMVIYCTEHIQGGFEVFNSITETNGGQCLLYRGRSGTLPVAAREASHVKGADAILISGDTSAQKKIWDRFKKQAQHAKKTPRIVRVDWLIETVMAQELRSVEKWEYTGWLVFSENDSTTQARLNKDASISEMSRILPSSFVENDGQDASLVGWKEKSSTLQSFGVSSSFGYSHGYMLVKCLVDFVHQNLTQSRRSWYSDYVHVEYRQFNRLCNIHKPFHWMADGNPAMETHTNNAEKLPAKRFKRQEYRKTVEQRNLESTEIRLPQKRLYRQRAHANPFSDHMLE
ncbi:hypothetical protein KEM54_005285 [Ascosphaera aggregata]|nr:hypothetical protein KEM54_005285 [Ascosphaera aggregata]